MKKEQIGLNAGIIWQFLYQNGNVKIIDIKKNIKMKIEDIYLALGWLARENKIHFLEIEKEVAICLINS